jgi:hypothetical protein
MQALPLYADGATASRRRTIEKAIARIGLQADKVHDAYQRLIKFDKDEQTLRPGRTAPPPSTTTYARTQTRYSEK